MGSVLHRLFTREISAPPKPPADETTSSSSATADLEVPPVEQIEGAPIGSAPPAAPLSAAESAQLFLAEWDADQAPTSTNSVPKEAASDRPVEPDTEPHPETPAIVSEPGATEPVEESLANRVSTQEELSTSSSKQSESVSTKENPTDEGLGPALEHEKEKMYATPSENETPSLNFVDSPRVDPEEWKLEEALASHREWLESRGLAGKKLDFAGANLADTELISADLRHADLQEANFRSADLLLADLRGACLARAQLDDACLVGANLEGANLENASLLTSMGLLPRQLAGANLHEASLPASIAEFGALADFTKASQMAARYFTTTLLYSLASMLLIWKTRDAQLLTDSAVLPYIHATTAIPTAEFYLISPAALLILYLVFHFHLQQTWEKLMELPAVFPDGRELGSGVPRIVMGLARSHFYWLSPESPSARFIEKWAVRLLAYWLVPFTLLLYWARYLTLQEIHGTLLHEALAVGAVGVALYSTQRIGRRAERWVLHPAREFQLLTKLKNASMPYTLAALALFLTFLSVGTMIGVPHDPARAPQYGPGNFRRWAPNTLWAAGIDPYADLTEAQLSLKPLDWTGDDSQIPAIQGPHLNQANLRYAQAYGAFLPNAHLWRADLEGAYLSLADVRGGDLSKADLQFAILDSAQFGHANLDRAALDGAMATRTDFHGANLSYVTFGKATLVDARFDGASLYSAHLNEATLIRANLEKADLRDAQLMDANLSHADLQQAYLWSAKLGRATLAGAMLQGAILIDADLSDADLRGAAFQGTVLNDAILNGAVLDGADLRRALGIGAAQICATKSHTAAVMDDALQAAVAVQCGGPVPQNAELPAAANPGGPSAAKPTSKP